MHSFIQVLAGIDEDESFRTYRLTLPPTVSPAPSYKGNYALSTTTLPSVTPAPMALFASLKGRSNDNAEIAPKFGKYIFPQPPTTTLPSVSPAPSRRRGVKNNFA